MLSNNQLHDLEIKHFKWFLSANENLKNHYPGKILYHLVEDILQDTSITEDKRNALKETLISFTGCNLELGIADGLSTQLPIDTINKLNLSGKTVCLTGEFIYGNRNVYEEEMKRQDANVISNITKKLDYLIVGTMSSKDWRYTSHGRKIEKAIFYRDKKRISLKIISEEQWQNLSYENR